MQYIDMLYGKKADFDKKYLPIIASTTLIICFLFMTVGSYYIFKDKFDLFNIFIFVFIALTAIIYWKSFNKQITVYLCEDGIYYLNRFISWDKFEDFKKDRDFIELLGKKRKILGKNVYSVQRIYLKYDKELEDIIKKHLRQK